MMQMSWIGRQVFTKFLRKNALLFSNHTSATPTAQPVGSSSSSSVNVNNNPAAGQGQHQQSPSGRTQHYNFSTNIKFVGQQKQPHQDGTEETARNLSTHNLVVGDLSHQQEMRLSLVTEEEWSFLRSASSSSYLKVPLRIGFPRDASASASGMMIPFSSKDCMTNAYHDHQGQGNIRRSILSNLSSRRALHTLSISDLNDEGSKAVIEKVTLAEMKRLFRKHEIPFEDGYTCLRVDCFFCKKGSRKKKTFPWESDKLFVNKTTGYFVCISCKITGTWRNLQDLVMLSKSGQGLNKAALDLLRKDEPIGKHEDKLNHMQMNSREVSSFSDEEWEPIARRFRLQKLKRSILEQYEMRYNGEEEKLLLPIYSLELKRVGYLVLNISTKTGDIDTNIVPKSCTESFGWKQILQTLSSSSTVKTRPLILVQSALDVLAIASGSSYLSLGLHPGCNHLPQEFLPKLEHFDEILLWFGNDVRSWETAKAFGRKLEERRCRLIRPIDLHPAPFLAMQQDMNFSKILSGAQLMEHKAITTFSKLREEVFSELSHQEKVAGVKWTRYPYLTKLLKGHRRGELSILTGSTGSGKTTFMSEYSLDLCAQGVNTLWGSFEIRNVRLAKTMLTQYSETDLEKHIEEYDVWADKFEKLPLYFMTFHGQQSIKAVLDAMNHSAYVYDIGHVIVDNLQFMLGVSDEKGGHIDRFWRQDLIVSAFRKFATVNNCHVTLVMHPRKEGNDTELSNSSIFGGAKASQEADNILILQDKRLTSPRGKKYLQITKNRFSGDLGMFTLEFNRDCLSFASRKKPRPDQSVIVKSKRADSTEDTFSSDSEILMDESNTSNVRTEH